MNILELLRPSDKTALIQGAKRISYSELLSAGLDFGERMQGEGITKGSHVLVFVPLSIELYIAMIGAWSVGATPIFIDFSRGAKFVNDSIDRLKPDCIICDRVTGIVRKMYANTRSIKMLKIKNKNTACCAFMRASTSGKIQAKNAELFKPEALSEEHPAILTFTSGTTGIPKVAVRTHGFLVSQYSLLVKYIDFSESHIDLGTLPVFTLANMASNMTTLLPDKSYRSKINAEKLATKMEKEGVTRAICSPALMANLLKYSQLPLIKNVYLGGGPVYPSILDKIRKDVDVNIVYGSTEAEPIAGIRWADVSTEDREQIAHGFGLLVGQVVPEVECKIDENSEILVSGETVLKGYLDGIGDKENKIRDGDIVWHRTGDAGYIDAYGRLWLLGRVNQVIEDENGRLYPFCVECILDTHYGIRGAILVHEGKRTVVIEKGSVDFEDVLCELKPQHIEDVIEVNTIPMDKRHGAKIDYEKLAKLIKM